MADTSKSAETEAAAARVKPKTIEGIVKSAKMEKTITVEVNYLQKHAKYGKYMKRYTKFYAHDENREAKEGDLVEIAQTRPTSKMKRFRLVKVVRKAEQV